ncbi:endoglucanase E-4 [Biomphalaria glabrata]|nr:endoglucanase E-4 [Biomphalaria glabrata]
MGSFWTTIFLMLACFILSASPLKNYSSALAKSILFYNAQRSGKLPANNPIPWRDDSALNDCVVGGWYDAGDYLKLGLPLSYTTTALLWSINRFSDGYQRAGQLTQMYDMIKWPLDYFLKAWRPAQNELVVQIGDSTDHSYWGRAEEMTMTRPCFKINTVTKGSDIAAGTAAALAAGSVAFMLKGDLAYSNQLLNASKSLYTYAKANRGVFTGSAEFYGSSGDRDELCEASMWLYKATRGANYLADARTFVDMETSWAYSWDEKIVGCQLMLYQETGETQYKDLVVSYFTAWMPGGTVTYTPCGLAWRSDWASNSYAGNSAFIALVAADSGINAASYRKWAVEQINYLLGDNPHSGGCYSYEVGYGSKYPLQPHHAGASCPNKPATCDWSQFSSTAPNPQTLHGALVGGPDQYDNFHDVRSDYIHNEVADDYNSGFQGALAGILHLQAINQFPATSNKCPCTA